MVVEACTLFVDAVKKRVGMPNDSFAATWKKLVHATNVCTGAVTRNARTGWRIPTWTDTSPDVVIVEKAAQSTLGGLGLYIRRDAVGVTCTQMYPDDILVYDSASWLVKAVNKIHRGAGTWFYLLELEELKLGYGGIGSGEGYNQTDDARYRAKLYIDTYDTPAKITKDDGSTQAAYATIFAKPPYQLEREFLAEATPVNGLYMVGIPDSEAIKSWNGSVIGYLEHTPVICAAIDKSGCTGTLLRWGMEAELRRIVENNPWGSYRTIRRVRDYEEYLQSVTMYAVEVLVSYKRIADGYTPSYPSVTWGPSATPTGTFVFPNTTRINLRLTADDAWLEPSGFTGALSEALGSGPIEIEITCDLDLEPAAKTWRRPQATTPKTDGSNYDVFLDLLHNEGIDQPYHTLTLQTNVPDNSTMALKVRLVSMTPDQSGEDNKVTLLFREYMTASASSQTIAQRFGITA